jgi:sugar/nucleoside kinase (ribokinase family)
VAGSASVSGSATPPLICTLGDVHLDVVVRLDGPIAVDTDTTAQTRVGPGGQAANVAAWAAALGARGRVVAKRARDAAGRLVAEELLRLGVELAGPEVELGTGTVVSIVTPDGRRSMLTDRGVSTDLRPDELEPDSIAGCDWLHVSGYSLVRPPLADAAAAAASVAPRVSLHVASVAAVREVGLRRFRDRAAGLGAEVVFATEEEAELVGGLGAETLVVKRGAAGCTVAGRDHPARSATVVDSTGAGDAFAAGFLVGGAELGLDAAARCVARLGAMP